MIGSGIRKLLARFSRARIEEQTEDEIRFHLEMEAQANQAGGMTAEDARRAARMDFGGEEQTRETVRDVYATFLDSLLQDIRYALRVFRRNRGFTLAAIITLALGISAATSIFSVVDATLFRPLPYPQPDRLVRIMGWSPEKASYYEGVSKDYFAAFREAQSFESVSMYTWYPSLPILYNPGGAENVVGATASPNLLRTLAAPVLYGRDFRPEEETYGNDKVVMLTYGAWQKRFGGDRNVIGRNLPFADGQRTIIGVLPADFRYPSLLSAFMPEMLIPFPVDWTRSSSDPAYYLLARLGPGIRLSEAQAEVNLISSRNNQSLPQDKRVSFRLLPLQEHLVKYKRTVLLLLFGAIMYLPLIGCLNISNMLLARGLARRQELGIRIALGAGRPRLARQLLTESLLLSISGGVLGVLLSFWMLPLLLAQLPSTLRLGLNDIAIDGRVLLFSLGLTLAATLIHGLWPAWSGSRTDIAGFLRKGDSRGGRGGAGGFKPALLVAESALAMVLLVGAGLLINSFLRLEALPVGFQTDNLCRISFYLPERRYPGIESVVDFQRNMSDRIRGIAGVAEVAAVDYPPLRGDMIGAPVIVPESRSAAPRPAPCQRRLLRRDRHELHFRTPVHGPGGSIRSSRSRDQRQHGPALLAGDEPAGPDYCRGQELAGADRRYCAGRTGKIRPGGPAAGRLRPAGRSGLSKAAKPDVRHPDRDRQSGGLSRNCRAGQGRRHPAGDRGDQVQRRRRLPFAALLRHPLRNLLRVRRHPGRHRDCRDHGVQRLAADLRDRRAPGPRRQAPPGDFHVHAAIGFRGGGRPCCRRCRSPVRDAHARRPPVRSQAEGPAHIHGYTGILSCHCFRSSLPAGSKRNPRRPHDRLAHRIRAGIIQLPHKNQRHWAEARGYRKSPPSEERSIHVAAE